MTIKNAYLTMQEASGIKVGDTVRVLRKAVDEEMGWGNSWKSPEMDKHIGETGIVDWCEGTTGFSVRFGCERAWSFPFFVLEKIADATRYITINGFEVPEPVRGPMRRGERYWVVSIAPFQDHGSTFCREYNWADDGFDRLWLQRGLIHRTQEAAEKHAKALLSFTAEKAND